MALIIDIKVIPSSGRALCSLDAQGNLKCHLKSPPEKGKANNELITMLAKKLNISKQDISIIAGAASRKKRIKIDGAFEHNQLLAALGLEVQKTLFGNLVKKRNEEH